ncbi:hypothetical protein LSH36_1561g00000 [Paralvinella palmiformis]|uniref:Purple acid phosphatase n=1 Tax=Paralvinella palmiformis TaxID=53620 RepID=A0AAD9ISL2_9ANNE|nr:hypothetical protein LSH36_1561g00000 [Paralvinella palmiformis]
MVRCFIMALIVLFFLIHLSSAEPLLYDEVLTRPEQIHLSLTGSNSEMMVTWVTRNSTGMPMVEYGLAGGIKRSGQQMQNELGWPKFDQVAVGETDTFIDGGSLHRRLYIHRVKMTGLKPKQEYVYHVGGALGWSDVYFFMTYPDGTTWSPRIVLFGDMGNENAQSLSRLQEETQRGFYDAIFHVGDFAYDMNTDNAHVGDEFMNQIQSIAAYVPYMTCVGNHEGAYNFSNYKNRFTMPGGDGEGMYFRKPVCLRTELKGHGLSRCVTVQCTAQTAMILNTAPTCKTLYIRTGVNLEHSFSAEQLLYKYGVDLHIQAHEHSYERMWPVYNLTVCNGSKSEPYRNPRAPVHIVTGSAGCKEKLDPFFRFHTEWSAFHRDDYGYTRINIINGTHLYLEQVSDDEKGAVIDKMTLIKEHHGSYDCHLGKK